MLLYLYVSHCLEEWSCWSEQGGMCSQESEYRLSCFEVFCYQFKAAVLFFFLSTCSKKHLETGFDKLCSLLTLEYGSILDDETLELSTDNLQARLHVAACSYLIPLLHLLGTAGRAFGLANLQVCTWQENSRDRTGHLDEQDIFFHTEKIHVHHLHANHRKHYLQQILSLNDHYVEAVLFSRAAVKNKMQQIMSHLDVYSHNIPRQCFSAQRSIWSTGSLPPLQATILTQRHKVRSQEQFSLQTNKPRFQHAFTLYDIKTSHERD